MQFCRSATTGAIARRTRRSRRRATRRRRDPRGEGTPPSGRKRPFQNPFAALSGANGRPLKVAILSDFTRIPYANGAVFQTRALYRALNTCGHQATLIGPRDPDATADEVPPGTVALPSLPLRTCPGVHLPIPVGSSVLDPMRWDFDICFAQTTTLLVEFGIWLRKMRGVPLLCVNTTHLAAAYDVLLPERVSRIGAVHTVLHKTLRAPMERLFVDLYNQETASSCRARACAITGANGA